MFSIQENAASQWKSGRLQTEGKEWVWDALDAGFSVTSFTVRAECVQKGAMNSLMKWGWAHCLRKTCQWIWNDRALTSPSRDLSCSVNPEPWITQKWNNKGSCLSQALELVSTQVWWTGDWTRSLFEKKETVLLFSSTSPVLQSTYPQPARTRCPGRGVFTLFELGF